MESTEEVVPVETYTCIWSIEETEDCYYKQDFGRELWLACFLIAIATFIDHATEKEILVTCKDCYSISLVMSDILDDMEV